MDPYDWFCGPGSHVLQKHCTHQISISDEWDACVPHPPLVNGYPVSSGEPLVSFDVVHSVFKVAEAFGEIHLQQVSQQVLQVGAEV